MKVGKQNNFQTPFLCNFCPLGGAGGPGHGGGGGGLSQHTAPALFNATFVRQVVQAEGPDMVVGAEDYPGIPPLLLTYHRHAYGLGEHYNSVLPTTTTTAS